METPSRSRARRQNVVAAPKKHGGLAVLLCFLATIGLLVAVGTGVARQRVFNADYLVTQLDKTDAGKQLAKVANAEISSIAEDRGLPSTVVPQTVTKHAAQQDLDQTVRNLLAGSDQPVTVEHIIAHNKSALTAKLNQQTANFFDQYGAANALTSGLTDTLETRLTNELNTDQVSKAVQEVGTVKRLVNVAFWIGIVVTVLCLIGLIWLDRSVFRFAKQFGWITLISGLLIFIGYFGVSSMGIVELAAATVGSFGTAAAALGNAVLTSYARPSYVLMIIGLLSLLLSLFGRRQRR